MNSETKQVSSSNTSARVKIRNKDLGFWMEDADGEHAAGLPDLSIFDGGDSCIGESSSFSNPLSSAIELRLLPDHDMGALSGKRVKEIREGVLLHRLLSAS